MDRKRAGSGRKPEEEEEGCESRNVRAPTCGSALCFSCSCAELATPFILGPFTDYLGGPGTSGSSVKLETAICKPTQLWTMPG